MKPKIYVDGQEGTTGLRIHDYLGRRGDLDVLRIDPEKRRDTAERTRLLNSADVAFLCLPDAASREAVALIENPATRIVDASTAFRTDPAWLYGIPELEPGYRARFPGATRVTVPGCHATGFVLAVRPLVKAGLIPADAALTCFSLTGYSGGGKKMIAEYQAADRPAALEAPRTYALALRHKHLPEMQAMTGLSHPPVFLPVVCDVYVGMAVHVLLPAELLARPAAPADVHALLARQYEGERFVRVMPLDSAQGAPGGTFDMTACNGTNRLDLYVVGHRAQIAVIACLDNLGKGASGAAVQCMNLMLGAPEDTGLAT